MDNKKGTLYLYIPNNNNIIKIKRSKNKHFNYNLGSKILKKKSNNVIIDKRRLKRKLRKYKHKKGGYDTFKLNKKTEIKKIFREYFNKINEKNRN